MRRGIRVALILAFALVASTPVFAHKLLLAKIQIQEGADGVYSIRYSDYKKLPEPILPARCQWSGSAVLEANTYQRAFIAEKGPLTRRDVLRLDWKRNGVVASMFWKNGANTRRFFYAGSNGISVDFSELGAGSGSFIKSAGRFIRLGVDHILAGADHLLFVTALLLLVRGRHKLLLAITGFTVAHSLTLVLAGLKLVRVNPPLVEALIALSIMFLAKEVLLVRVGRETLATRQPWLISSGFGLVHGLGFAEAFKSYGLENESFLRSLLFFNVGVELGQLLFIVLCFLMCLIPFRMKWINRRLSWLPAYVIGCFAAYWFFERLAVLFSVA